MKKVILNILLAGWRVLFNPVTVISVVSLLVHNNTVVGIRADLGIPYRMTEKQINNSSYLTSQLKELGQILNHEWNYAMSDMNMQNLILIVAVILALYEFINGLIPLTLTPHSIKKIILEIKSDVWTMIFFSVTILIFGGIFYVYLGNKSANLETLQLYLPPKGIITGETRWPPIESLITICRYVISIYGVINSIYFNYHFPKFLNAIK